MARRVMTHSIISEPLISVPKSAGRVKRVLSQTYAKKKIPNHTFPSDKLDKKGQNENYCTVNTIVGVISINTLLQYCKYQTKNQSQKSS